METCCSGHINELVLALINVLEQMHLATKGAKNPLVIMVAVSGSFQNCP